MRHLRELEEERRNLEGDEPLQTGMSTMTGLLIAGVPAAKATQDCLAVLLGLWESASPQRGTPKKVVGHLCPCWKEG